MENIFFLLIVFVANIIQVVTGFAGTLLAMPVSMILIGVNEAKAILNIMGLLASIWIAIRNFRDVDKKEFLKITSIMLIGIIAGIAIFNIAPVENLLQLYALLIIGIAIKSLFVKKKFSLPKGFMVVVIALAGVIHGMFISGGSLLVIYAAATFKDKSVFRATLSAVWVVLNSYLMVSHINQGYISNEVIVLTLICILPLVGGILLGNMIHKKINQQAFLKLTYVLLMVSGLLLFF